MEKGTEELALLLQDTVFYIGQRSCIHKISTTWTTEKDMDNDTSRHVYIDRKIHKEPPLNEELQEHIWLQRKSYETVSNFFKMVTTLIMRKKTKLSH